MILGTAFFIKVVLTLACGFGIFWLLREKTAKRYMAVLLALITAAVGAFLGQKVSELVPPLTDTVTITALGEKNPEASGMEVFLTGYVVDGVKYGVDEIEEGKWFWSGTNYKWRPETDRRQPEGTTRTIKVAVPVGWERTVTFASNQYCGMVSVEFDGVEAEIDAYSTKNATTSFKIGKSATFDLVLNQMRYLAVFAVILFLLSGAVIFSARFYISESGNAWVKRNKAVLVIAAIALAQFIFAVKYSGIDCFWYDELAEIRWSVSSDNLIERAFRGNAPLPIFGFFMGIWYEIAPYGEKWLLLPMEIGTALGIFFVGIAGRELRNNFVGIISALFAAVSSTVLVQCSYEIRSYGFYFAGAALVLFFFLRHIRRREEESWKAIIGMGFSMIFFAGMHYHAVFYTIMLFIIDALFLVYHSKLSKKTGIRLIIPYMMAALSYVPNLIAVWKKGTMENIDNHGFHLEPTYEAVQDLFDYFSSGSDVLQLAFFMGFSVILSIVLVEIRNKNGTKDINRLKIAVPVLWLSFVLLFFVIFGNYRYGNGDSTLWYNRYFVGLLPSFFLVAGMGCYYLPKLAKRCMGNDVRAFFAAVAMLCILILPSAVGNLDTKAQKVRYPYRAAADWLYGQGNYIYNANTLVITTRDTVAWNEYYLTKQGTRDQLNLRSQSDVTSENLQQFDRIYVQYIHYGINANFKKILEEEFELVSEQEDIKIKVYVRKN